MNPESNRIKKGPSVAEARSQSKTGKVKASDLLLSRPTGLDDAVESARAAMVAAGEAPAGNPNEARAGASANASSDSQTRWRHASRPSTVVKVDKTEVPQFVPSDPENGFLVRFSYENGEQEVFECKTRVQMIREVKRRQAILFSKKQKATVEIAEIGADEAPVSTEVGATETTPATTPENTSQRGTGGSTRPDTVEKLENSKFILEIFQEDGEWVGRIKYKNGAGTEEFRADTRRALDMKLLEGKAHATLKVREVLRRDQYHDDLDKVYDIPGYTQESFDSLSPESQQLVIDSIAGKAAILFKEEVPEFYGSQANTTQLLTFLHKRDLPVTLKNLKYAFEELADDLEQRPQAKISVTETPAPAVATVAADSAPTPVVPAVVSTTPAPTATTTEVRKRGSFGFKPGFTSLGSNGLEETEGGKKSTEPSEKDARSMPLEELAKQVRSKYNRNRQF